MNQNADGPVRLTLYVTGDAPRSCRARTNLGRALASLKLSAETAREIDLIQSPQEALRHGIFATPALLRQTGDEQPAILYGDLSNEISLQQFLNGLTSQRSTDDA
jgi:circadian clock protein KaiB